MSLLPDVDLISLGDPTSWPKEEGTYSTYIHILGGGSQAVSHIDGYIEK